MLFGTCNRCGNCCQMGGYVCDNLEGVIGQQTTCRVYDKRYDGMMITMTNAYGSRLHATCSKGKSEEPQLKDLIDEGKCSYRRLRELFRL